MALFHFRIKSDKKPDESKISDVKHIGYIRCERDFADIDRQPVNANFVDNLISSAEIKDACGGLDSFLYITDDFGFIKNFPEGIEVSDKVMNHQPLIISGPDDFKKSVINAAISDDLPLSFADLHIHSS